MTSTTDEDIQNTSIIATSVQTTKSEPPKLPTFFQIVGRIIKKITMGRSSWRCSSIESDRENIAVGAGLLDGQMLERTPRDVVAKPLEFGPFPLGRPIPTRPRALEANERVLNSDELPRSKFVRWELRPYYLARIPTIRITRH